MRVPGLDTARLSLLMSEPIHIADLLLLLVRDTQESIVLDPDIDGTFVGELKDVTLRQALDIALAPHELEYAVEGGVIRVFPRRTATRFFDIDYVTTRRSATPTLRAPTMPLAATASSAEVTRTDQEYFFEQVADGVGALLSPRGRMHLDRKAALVQVTDYPDRLAPGQLLDGLRAFTEGGQMDSKADALEPLERHTHLLLGTRRQREPGAGVDLERELFRQDRGERYRQRLAVESQGGTHLMPDVDAAGPFVVVHGPKGGARRGPDSSPS